MLLSRLAWADVAPSSTSLDLARAERVVSEVARMAAGGDLTRRTFAPGWNPHALHAAIDQALIEAIGPWATGFSCSCNDGGIVRAYCCASHSVLPKGDADARGTVARVLAALTEWHTFLVSLEETFDVLHTSSGAMPIERAVERAASELVLCVLARNDASDAWYRTFGVLLTWYLESAGHARAEVAEVVERVCEGRFASWVAPSSTARAEAASELGLEVAIAHDRVTSSADTPDALARWRAIRETAFANAGYVLTLPVAWDAHRRFIDGPETARDPARARRMSAALDACRARADTNAPLTFELCAKWQAIVLGEPAGFRTGEAFAKAGRERYALDASTQQRFSHWLTQADDLATPIHVRAARVYLDVCFTHPFDDGNAREARLALDYVLAREGFVLRAVAPIFLLARDAADQGAARALAHLVGAYAGRP